MRNGQRNLTAEDDAKLVELLFDFSATYRDIAKELGTSEAAVKLRVQKRINQKLGADNRYHAVEIIRERRRQQTLAGIGGCSDERTSIR